MTYRPWYSNQPRRASCRAALLSRRPFRKSAGCRLEGWRLNRRHGNGSKCNEYYLPCFSVGLGLETYVHGLSLLQQPLPPSVPPPMPETCEDRAHLITYARRPPFHLTCSGNVRADGGGSGEHHTRGGPGRALPKPVVRPRVAANGKGEREEADRHLSLIPACADRGHRIYEEDYERTGAVTPPSAFCFWAKENLSYGCSCGVPLVGEERKSVECVRVVPLATHIQTTHPKTHRATYSFQECGESGRP